MEETGSTQLEGPAPSSSQPDIKRGERGVPPQEAKIATPSTPQRGANSASPRRRALRTPHPS